MEPNACPGCSQKDREIDALKKRVADLEQRLDEKTRASKRQAAPFSKGEPKPNPKKPGRKAGDQHGKHGHRPPPADEDIDETLEAPLPDACPHCGGSIDEDDVVDEQFQTDIPTKPIRRKFRIHKGKCTACGRRVRGRHPLQTSDAVGAAESSLGPNVQTSMVYLNKRCGMPHGKIADYFGKANDLIIRPSTVTRTILRVAQKLEPVYQEIKESIKDSKYITPDETGWKRGGRLVWLHVWVGDQATCFVIDPRRSADALEKVIGLDYSGGLIRDGYSSYDRFVDAIHQLCVDHSMRRAQDLEESLVGRAKLFPRQVIDLMKEGLELRDAFLVRGSSEEERGAAYEDFSDRLRDLVEKPRANQVNATFAGHLSHYAPYWFTFLLQPEVPATNHQGEQAIRMPIGNRKMGGGGNREDTGCHAQAVECSVIKTCEQQKRSPFQFIGDAIRGVVQSIFQKTAGKSSDTAKS